MRTCSIDGCERPHWGRGWCRPHHACWYATGDPETADRAQAEVAALQHRGVPVSENGPRRLGRDTPYPLVCICETPEPEWVYVAYQCATCKRLIQETT